MASNNFNIKIATKLDTSNIKSDIKKLNESVKKSPLKLKLELSTTDKSYLNTIKEIVKANKNIQLSFKDVTKSQTKTNESFKQSATSVMAYQEKIRKTIADIDKFSVANKRIVNDGTLADLAKMKIEVNALTNTFNPSKLTEYKNQLNAIKDEISIKKTSSLVDQNDVATLQKLNAKMALLAASKDKAFKRDPRLLQDLVAMSQQGEKLSKGPNLSASQQSIKKLSAEFTQLNSKIQVAQQKTMSFKETLIEASSKFGLWSGVTTLYFKAIQGLQAMITNVIELDTSLTELRKVTDLTDAQIVQFTKSAYGAGEAIGRTGKEVVDATTIFSQAGYAIKDALDLSQTALTMMNVGDGIEDVDTASKTLISTMKGFDIESGKSIEIVDKLNKVSNTSAISFSDLAEGMTRVSAVMNQADTSIEQTTGLLTG